MEVHVRFPFHYLRLCVVVVINSLWFNRGRLFTYLAMCQLSGVVDRNLVLLQRGIEADLR